MTDDLKARLAGTMKPCPCHPTSNEVGFGELCLNCQLSPTQHNPVGYCRNSTRQYDWYKHRQEANEVCEGMRITLPIEVGPGAK